MIILSSRRGRAQRSALGELASYDLKKLRGKQILRRRMVVRRKQIKPVAGRHPGTTAVMRLEESGAIDTHNHRIRAAMWGISRSWVWSRNYLFKRRD